MTVNIGDQPYTMNLFDTAGQEGYDKLRPLTYSETDVFLICFSVVQPDSYANIKEIVGVLVTKRPLNDRGGDFCSSRKFFDHFSQPI